MKDFFISHNKADKEWAEWISWQLEEAGYTTFLPTRDIRPGSNFVLEMQKAASESERTIAVLSQDYLDALFTHPEWAAAFAKDPKGDGHALVPVRVGKCELTGLLSQIVYIDLKGLKESEARETLDEGLKWESAIPKIKPGFPGQKMHTKDEPPNFPGSLPPIWNVPLNRNPNFTGRVELLERLRETLLSGKPAALTQAITGLGGVGKTQLALEYSHRHASEYEIVWWIRAEEPAKLAADYAELAQRLDLEEKDAHEQKAIGRAVRDWLNHNSGWLIVFDNAQNAGEIKDYLPQGQGGHVIVTSRDPNWSGVAGKLSVHVMEPDEAKEFLLKRTGQSDEETAADIAKELGYLPLALEQAGAYIEETEESLSNYLEMYREDEKELLGDSGPPLDYPHTVATTWAMAFPKIKKESRAAIELMNLCAFLAPDDIPLDIVAEGAKHLPRGLRAVVKNARKLNKVKRALRRYSLVEISGDNLTIHRLVQAVIRDRLPEEEKKKWAEAAVRIIDDAFPGRGHDVRTWPECSRLLAHAMTSTEHAEGFDVALDEVGHLLNQAGLYLKGRAEFSLAKMTYERAIRIAEGRSNVNLAAGIANLGGLLCDMSDLENALILCKKALDIAEGSLGADDPRLVEHINSVGAVFLQLGNTDEARKYLERALKVAENTNGPDHPQVAMIANNLGLTLRALGDLEGAREKLEHSLSIDKVEYGNGHPIVAIRIGNLGRVLRDMGKVKEARANFERTLEIFRNYFDEDHPKVIQAKKDLASLDGLEEG